jgi:hypothetical protein
MYKEFCFYLVQLFVIYSQMFTFRNIPLRPYSPLASVLFHSEHSYGTTRDSDEEDAEPEDGERLDHPYSAPQVCSYMLSNLLL